MPLELKPEFDAAQINALLDGMEAETRTLLAESGVTKDIAIERFAEMRLVGQMHQISVALPEGEITPAQYDELRAAFTKAYEARYSKIWDGARIEAINFRLMCRGPRPSITLDGASGGADTPALKGHRQAWFEDRWHAMAVYDRYALTPGATIEGPAAIEEREATTILPPGDRLTVDASLNLRLAIAAPKSAAEIVSEAMDIETAMARIAADPVALEVMWSRLITVTEEMWLTVVRTAFSLTVSESQDFACELLDPEGETLAHSPRAMPVFNLTLPRAVKALLEKYPVETLSPGDVLITNDPWLCAGHLYDIAIVTPVFAEGRVVGLIGTVGHVSDIGGTRDATRAREVYEEGLQIPPMKFIDKGVVNETLEMMIRQNIRGGDQVLGDLHGFVSANALGAERLLSFMKDYGLRDLRAMARLLQGLSEKAMREAIRALPDGSYHSTIQCRPLDQVLSYPVKLTVVGDEIVIDFEGAPPQLPQGGLNSTLNYTTAHATYPLKCLLTPNVRGNAGCYRPFTVKAPEGSALNPRYPASVAMRTRTGWYLAPNIFRALSQAAPDQVQAHTGLPVATVVYGELPNQGGRFINHLFMGGGQGGAEGRDGHSALLWPTSACNTSIEVFESRAPILVVEKTYLPDSGGPGQWRGGLGQKVRLRKLWRDGEGAFFSVYPEGVGVGVEGLFGGKAGLGASGRVLTPAGVETHNVGTGELVRAGSPDEIIELCVTGGSGYGSPSARDPEALARDLRLGFVTREAALRDYPAALAALETLAEVG